MAQLFIGFNGTFKCWVLGIEDVHTIWVLIFQYCLLCGQVLIKVVKKKINLLMLATMLYENFMPFLFTLNHQQKQFLWSSLEYFPGM